MTRFSDGEGTGSNDAHNRRRELAYSSRNFSSRHGVRRQQGYRSDRLGEGASGNHSSMRPSNASGGQAYASNPRSRDYVRNAKSSDRTRSMSANNDRNDRTHKYQGHANGSVRRSTGCRASDSHNATSHPLEDFAPRHRSANASVASSGDALWMRALSAVWHGIKSVFVGIGHAFTFIWSKSKALGCVILAAAFIVCLVMLDTAFTNDRIYKGVTIGDVDVSNMSVVEATEAVNSFYTNNLYSTSVYIFADEDTKNSADTSLQTLESDSLAEQLSFEDAQKAKKLWITSAVALEAYIPAEELAQKALSIGRDSGVMDRAVAVVRGYKLPVHANFNETLLTNLISDINATLGYPVVDFGVEIADAEAKVTEGNVGYVLDDEEFTSEISDILLADDSSIVGFVPEIKYTSYRIDEDKATLTADSLNSLMPDSVQFQSDGNVYNFDKQTYCTWISTYVEDAPDGYFLNPKLDSRKAASDILEAVNADNSDQADNLSVPVTFIDQGDEGICVQPQSDVSIPNVEEAISNLDLALFDEFRKTLSVPALRHIEAIPIQMQEYSGSLPIEEALEYGLVTRFSVFTTNYTNTTSTANRTFNIHRAADLIGSSIAKANGGSWSFNSIAGSCDEANGFREAGVIESGEYTTGIGGGICQVATTVFNAVFQSGLPINERHNHTLYSASYPAGRDAAIAFPTMDLIWTNDTSSDILLRTSYTDTSITVSLVGRDPSLNVESKTGEWVDGEKYSTKYELDENLAENASYIKTAGTNGMSITVVRTVKDSGGNTVRENSYSSTYSPITRTIAFGPGTDMEALRQKYDEPSNDGKSRSSA